MGVVAVAHLCVNHNVHDGRALLGKRITHGGLDLLGLGDVVALASESFYELLVASCD